MMASSARLGVSAHRASMQHCVKASGPFATSSRCSRLGLEVPKHPRTSDPWVVTSRRLPKPRQCKMLPKMGMVCESLRCFWGFVPACAALWASFSAHSISKSPLLAQAAVHIPWDFLSSLLGFSSPAHVTHRLLASGNRKPHLYSTFSSKGSRSYTLHAAYRCVPCL